MISKSGPGKYGRVLWKNTLIEWESTAVIDRDISGSREVERECDDGGNSWRVLNDRKRSRRSIIYS